MADVLGGAAPPLIEVRVMVGRLVWSILIAAVMNFF